MKNKKIREKGTEEETKCKKSESEAEELEQIPKQHALEAHQGSTQIRHTVSWCKRIKCLSWEIRLRVSYIVATALLSHYITPQTQVVSDT
jgi:hypothetical protein